jgi:BTB/POZ domain-containing protein KCTD2/5/17
MRKSKNFNIDPFFNTKIDEFSGDKILNFNEKIIIPQNSWIKLNVGGKLFNVSRDVLCKDPNSMLSKWFSVKNENNFQWESNKDENGAYLIDQEPEYFEPLLNYLRYGSVLVKKNVDLDGKKE